MTRFRFSLCFVLAIGLSTSPANAVEYEFSRSLTAPSVTQPELLAVTLDSAVFEATQAGLPDLRLLNSLGEAVPYLLRKVQTTREATVRNAWPARQPDARPLNGKGLEITFTLDEDDPQPNGLTIVTQLRDFEQRVRVFSSPTGEQWEPLVEEAVIFDYSRFMDVRRDEVQFKETRDRHFRIVIDDVTAEQESELLALTRRLQGVEETERVERVTVKRRPFRIERIDLWRETQEEQSTGDKKAEYPVSGFRVEQDPEKQQTLILVDTDRQPLTSLELQTPARNFSRRAAVEIEQKRGVQTSWRQIGQGTLSRIDFKDLNEEQLAIDFSETRQDAYRLVIDDRDSPPLKVSDVKARGNVYELVFLAAPGSSYRLMYGSADAELPQYDTVAIRQVLSKGFQPAQAKLGPQGPGILEPSVFQWSKLLNNRFFLFSAIALLVIVLGWGLYNATKRFDDLPSE